MYLCVLRLSWLGLDFLLEAKHKLIYVSALHRAASGG